MARKRVIYQSEALYVGHSGAETSQLRRIQSANYSFDIARTDVNQFGQLAAIDRIILEQPTVALDFNYLVSDGYNEAAIGLSVNHDKSCISHLLSGKAPATGNASNIWSSEYDSDNKNFYILTSQDGSDAVGGTATGIIGIGNAQITNWSVNASVGDFISADATFEGLNMTFNGDGSALQVKNPAVRQEDGSEIGGTYATITLPAASAGTGTGIPTALRPGDVSVGLDTTLDGKKAFQSGTLGILHTDLKVQSFSCNLGLGRTPLEKLGSRFAFSKEIDFPVSVSMDFSANMGELEQLGGADDAGADDLQNLLADDGDFTLEVKCKPISGKNAGLKFKLRGAKLDSQSMSSSIGDNKSVDLSFSAQVGGPQDAAHGLVIQRINSAGNDFNDLTDMTLGGA